MKKRLVQSLALLLLILGPVISGLAQPNPGKQPGGDPVNGGPVGGNAPIGSGIVLMVGMGIAYGIKKLSKHNNQSEEAE